MGARPRRSGKGGYAVSALRYIEHPDETALDFSREDIREELDAMAVEMSGELTALAEWMAENYSPSDALDAMSPTELNSLAASLYAERGRLWLAWREKREGYAVERLGERIA